MTTQARLLFERASHGVDANTAEGATGTFMLFCSGSETQRGNAPTEHSPSGDQTRMRFPRNLALRFAGVHVYLLPESASRQP